ncbi:hypothetical protein HJD18_08040 [Thermoleophilia bacterium SCSIO 60948]|nr:hypothetical protein HJD18_08040 [Thermoleophilia bacterium SCSIO 60948]
MKGRVFEELRGHYGALLAVLLCSIVFQLGAPDSEFARVIVIALQGFALVLAFLAAGVRRVIVIPVAALAILAVGGAVLAVSSTGLDELPARLVTLILIATGPVAIALGLVRGIRANGITLQTMFGTLCLYLFIGLLFSGTYGAIGAGEGTAFFGRESLDVPSNFLYFSYATLTTVGYGDLAAATDVGRSFAILEALLGQIYMVTVVALIVGNLHRRRDPAP